MRRDTVFVKKPIIRVFIGVLVAMFILAGVIRFLIWILGDHEMLYAGKSLNTWMQQLDSHDTGASNQANEALNTEIIPRLLDQMYHDTNVSKLRLSLIKTVNHIPGVRIDFSDAMSRRIRAADDLATFGPFAKTAVPSLIQALKGPAIELHGAAIVALGRIHSNPDAVVPLLIPFLTNDDYNEEVAIALGNYGGEASEAFPKIVPLLHAGDGHTRRAARAALKKIDPKAAAKFSVEK
jgi:hypothetical protein